MFTKPLKKGKFGDALFSNMVIEEKGTQDKTKMLSEKEYQDKIDNVKLKKKNREFKQSFRPSSVSQYTVSRD